MPKTICFVAGHSGGHIVPCLTMAAELKEHNAAQQILFISGDAPLDRTVIGNHPALDTVAYLKTMQVPYRKPWLLPRFVFTVLRTFAASWRLLRRHRPHKVVTTGGFIAIPVCLAAWLLRIPIELFELNVLPGNTIRALAPLAQTINVVFETTKARFPAHKTKLKPYPIRFTQRITDREELFDTIRLHPERQTLFVIGGSQGSQALNNLITTWILRRSMVISHLQVIHQAGSAEAVAHLHHWYNQHHIPSYVFAYSDQIAPLYQAADMVVTRAGSGTLAELQFFEKKAIIIPLETQITDHQLHNAQAVAQLHPQLFTVMRQQDIEKKADEFYQALCAVFAHPRTSPSELRRVEG